MININSIQKYIKLYQDIVGKYKIIISEQDLNNLYQLALLIFELDNLFDENDNYPSQEELEAIKNKMVALIPNGNLIGLQAIDFLFKAMDAEQKIDLNKSLTQYLTISSKTIGSEVLTSYLISKLAIDPLVWFSKIIVKFNDEINNIIRLANDYLDVSLDRERIVKEAKQIKAIRFFWCKVNFKLNIIYRYFIHKIIYFIYLIIFRYLKISKQWQDYWQAIACSESILDWAFKVYIIDKNSCRLNAEVKV
jgi:hypothetical protein